MQVMHSGDDMDTSDQRYRTSGRIARTIYSVIILAIIGYALYFFGRPYLVLEGVGHVVAPVQAVSLPYAANVRVVNVDPGQLVYPGALLATVDRPDRSAALRVIDGAMGDVAKDIEQARETLQVEQEIQTALKSRLDELTDALERTDQNPDAVDMLTRAAMQREYTQALDRWQTNQARLQRLPGLITVLEDNRERLRRQHADIRTSWENFQVLATEAGTVGVEVVREGASLQPGEPIVEILDQTQRFVRWELPQRLLRLPQAGEAVTVIAANTEVQGIVDRVLPLAQPNGDNQVTTNRLVDVSLGDSADELTLESSVTVRMRYF